MNFRSSTQELLDGLQEYKHGLNSLCVLENTDSTSRNSIGLSISLLEGIDCKIELVPSGFKLCNAEERDSGVKNTQQALDIHKCVGTVYESMDSLLNSISPMYRRSFSNQLSNKLLALASEQ